MIPTQVKGSCSERPGFIPYFIDKFITEMAVPTPRGCFSPKVLSADSQTTPPYFLSLFFLLLLGCFTTFQSSSRFLPKLSLTPYVRHSLSLKNTKSVLGRQKSCYFWFTDEVLQCGRSNSDFLEVNAKIHLWLPAGQGIIPNSLWLIYPLFGHRFIHDSESSPCLILEALETPPLFRICFSPNEVLRCSHKGARCCYSHFSLEETKKGQVMYLRSHTSVRSKSRFSMSSVPSQPLS